MCVQAHLNLRQMWLQHGNMLKARDRFGELALHLQDAPQVAESHRQPLRLHDKTHSCGVLAS